MLYIYIMQKSTKLSSADCGQMKRAHIAASPFLFNAHPGLVRSRLHDRPAAKIPDELPDCLKNEIHIAEIG